MNKTDFVEFFEKYFNEKETSIDKTTIDKVTEILSECYEPFVDLFEEANCESGEWHEEEAWAVANLFADEMESFEDVFDPELKAILKEAAYEQAFETSDLSREELAAFYECDLDEIDYMYAHGVDEIDDSDYDEEYPSHQEGYCGSAQGSQADHNSGVRRLSDETLDSPQKIYHWIEQRIYGQKEAVKAAAMLLYNHVHGRKRNLLFVGPTGCGKTEIWRVCKELYPQIRIIDGTMITQEGWKGEFKLENIFDGMDEQDAKNAIIVIDEFDKLCEPQIGSSGTNHSRSIQNGLLKFIEGTKLTSKDIDTSEVSFVFCGSFEYLTEMKTDKEEEKSLGFGAKLEKSEARLVYEKKIQPEDLVKYAGMRQEIAGRIGQIVQLSPMTAKDYKVILNDKRISPLHQMEEQYNIKLTLSKATEEKLVQKAEETHLGVRYLRSRIQGMLDDVMFQDAEQPEYELCE